MVVVVWQLCDGVEVGALGLAKALGKGFTSSREDRDVGAAGLPAHNFGDVGALVYFPAHGGDPHELALRMARQIGDRERVIDVATRIGIEENGDRFGHEWSVTKKLRLLGVPIQNRKWLAIRKLDGMLETPLFGRFVGENKRLVFSAAVAYYNLIYFCIGGGGLGALYGLLAPILGVITPVYPTWWVTFGSLVAAAGFLAILSLELIVFDLRERTYRRRMGGGFLTRPTNGRISELDALVLIAEAGGMRPGVTYHLVLHWKGMKEPPMVLQSDSRVLVPGAPLQMGAGQMLGLGQRYAGALGVPLYDNSHFVSPNPKPIFR